MRVAVIGGGPSGLATLKYLTTAHLHFPVKQIEVILLEASTSVGGVFFHHSYEDGEMVSSKFLTAFSDFRAPLSAPDFFDSQTYTQYLIDYTSHFALWPYIKLRSKVTNVRRREGGGHHLFYQTEGGEEVEFQCDAIAVCSGLHDKPTFVDIPGVENVPKSFHSEQFKTRSQLEGKSVMILGAGETAADIAYLGMTTPSCKKVVMCHRDGWLGAPKAMPQTVLMPDFRGWKQKDFDGMDPFNDSPVPIDVSQSTLFDTMYVHPMVRDSLLVWQHYKLVSLDAAWIASGIGPYDQYIGRLPTDKNWPHKTTFMKAQNRIQPFMVPPYRPKNPGMAERIRRHVVGTPWADAGRYIDLAPFPTHFDSNGVAHFADNGRPEYQRIKDQVIKPDVVIYATGYKQTFSFFVESRETVRQTGKKAYPIASEANVRNIWKRDDPTVGFIGYLRPGLGAIPGLAEVQAMMWTMNILGRIDPDSLDPNDEPHYRLLTPPGSRIKYAIEHESYVWQLACDMGCAPGFFDILRIGWNGPSRAWYRLPILWGCGNHFNAKFRLLGPWQWDGAVEILNNELWTTITRRKGLFGNFTLAVMPILLLGTASFLAWIWCWLWALLASLHLARPVKYRNRFQEIWDENLRIEAEMKKKEQDGSMAAPEGNESSRLLQQADGKGTENANGNGTGNGAGYGTL